MHKHAFFFWCNNVKVYIMIFLVFEIIQEFESIFVGPHVPWTTTIWNYVHYMYPQSCQKYVHENNNGVWNYHQKGEAIHHDMMEGEPYNNNKFDVFTLINLINNVFKWLFSNLNHTFSNSTTNNVIKWHF